MPEALFFYDESGQCIWANKPGIALAGVGGEDFERIPERLGKLFGDYARSDEKWASSAKTGEGENERCYVLEKRSVKDDNGHNVGSYLSVRDNTSEQLTLEREKYKATHDSLTGLYDRAGYEILVNSLPIETMYFLLIDLDRFKEVNDTWGHETGDLILQKLASVLQRNFRAEDFICRIGGDEFAVFMVHSDTKQRENIITKTDRINEEMSDTSDGLPPVSISVGAAHGQEGTDHKTLFEQADIALYETKRLGRRGCTFYSEGMAVPGDRD